MNASELWRARLNVPAYRVGEAATYAGISPTTITFWEKQRNYLLPVIRKREKKLGLSFLQLIEIAVVSAMRKQGVKLPDIRAARGYIGQRLGLNYPFAQAKFKADGVDILLDYEDIDSDSVKGKLVTANRGGQMIWAEALSNRLREFNYGSDGNVDSWKVNGFESDIEISPKVSFGAPNIFGIATAAIRQRWVGGYSIDDIADDLELTQESVEEAIKFERLIIDRERKSLWIN